MHRAMSIAVALLLLAGPAVLAAPAPGDITSEDVRFWGMAALFLLIILSPFLLYIAVRMTISTRREKKRAAAKHEANRLEAKTFLDRAISDGAFTPIETSVILKGEEQALLEDAAELYEMRAYRVYGGAGTSIRGVHVGGGASESRDRLRSLGFGTLVLTTQRLIFDGASENRTVKLADIVSATPLLDAIEISTEKRAKSMIFTVPNPLLWGPVINAVASGKGRP